MELLTATQAAKEIGIHQRTVRRLCALHGIGLRVSARVLLIPRSKIPALRRLKKPAGNPNFGKPKSKTG